MPSYSNTTMEKIAVPTRDGRVDDHFGHCAFFTLLTLDGGRVVERATLPSPEGCGCKSDIASVLRDAGVETMLAGNMGAGALGVLARHGIRAVRGCSGPVEEVAAAYLRGELHDSGEGCHAHGEGHSCPGHTAPSGGFSADGLSLEKS